MAFLPGLGLFQRILGCCKISAGILPVGIQKQVVQLICEIIVVLDVALRQKRRIEQGEGADEAAQSQPHAPQSRAVRTTDIA